MSDSGTLVENTSHSEELAIIDIVHRVVDDWHVFTSDEIFGLYVASEDPKQAYDMLAPAVEELLRLNEGLEVRAEAMFTLQELLARHRSRKQAKPVPAFAIRNQRFLIRSAA